MPRCPNSLSPLPHPLRLPRIPHRGTLDGWWIWYGLRRRPSLGSSRGFQFGAIRRKGWSVVPSQCIAPDLDQHFQCQGRRDPVERVEQCPRSRLPIEVKTPVRALVLQRMSVRGAPNLRKDRRSLGGSTANVLRSPKSNWSGREGTEIPSGCAPLFNCSSMLPKPMASVTAKYTWEGAEGCTEPGLSRVSVFNVQDFNCASFPLIRHRRHRFRMELAGKRGNKSRRQELRQEANCFRI